MKEDDLVMCLNGQEVRAMEAVERESTPRRSPLVLTIQRSRWEHVIPLSWNDPIEHAVGARSRRIRG